MSKESLAHRVPIRWAPSPRMLLVHLCVILSPVRSQTGDAITTQSVQWGFLDGSETTACSSTAGGSCIIGNYDYNKACVVNEANECVTCETTEECLEAEFGGEAGSNLICDTFGWPENVALDGPASNDGTVRRRGIGPDGVLQGKCAQRPPVPTAPEFGYFSMVSNRSLVGNFTISNITRTRKDGSVRDCTVEQRELAACAATALCKYNGESLEISCVCPRNSYGDPLVTCTQCPSGIGLDNGVAWTSTSPEGSTHKNDCRVPWQSHTDVITISNDVLTLNLDQHGLRSSVFNSISPKWNQHAGAEYGNADPGSGSIVNRALFDCRAAATAANNLDELSSHCRHSIGQTTGHVHAGAGRVFRYTADHFRIKLKVIQGRPGEDIITTVLSTKSMVLEEFKLAGVGQDCGREDCGGANATYKYRLKADNAIPHHTSRRRSASRADLKGPRGYVHPNGGSQSSKGEIATATLHTVVPDLRVTVLYSLEPGKSFVDKILAVHADSATIVVLEELPFHNLQGCQVVRPSDDCPDRSA